MGWGESRRKLGLTRTIRPTKERKGLARLGGSQIANHAEVGRLQAGLLNGEDAVIVRGLNLPEFDIELILSGKTAKLLRMKPAERASAEPVHFLATWRVELAEDGNGGRWFLITNAVTMYSILIPRVRNMGFDELAQQFVMRLRFTLLGARTPIDWRPGAVRAVRGGSASLIGTMNNMVYLLAARRSRSSRQAESEEEILNDTPFFAIPENFPKKAFFGRLDQGAR